MKFKTLFILLLAAAIYSAGCMTVNIEATGFDKTASFTGTDRKFTIQKHFTRELKSWYLLLNLIPVSGPDIAQILRDETASAKGDAVINIKVKGEIKLADAGVPVAMAVLGSIIYRQGGALAGLIVGVRTYTIEGDVIKYLE